MRHHETFLVCFIFVYSKVCVCVCVFSTRLIGGVGNCVGGASLFYTLKPPPATSSPCQYTERRDMKEVGYTTGSLSVFYSVGNLCRLTVPEIPPKNMWFWILSAGNTGNRSNARTRRVHVCSRRSPLSPSRVLSRDPRTKCTRGQRGRKLYFSVYVKFVKDKKKIYAYIYIYILITVGKSLWHNSACI